MADVRFKMYIWMVLWLAVCASCSTITEDEDIIEKVKVGDLVPLFTVTMTYPETTDSQQEQATRQWSTMQLKGQTVIVFFNTSCKDCQRDLPLLNKYYLEHKDEPDFQMVAISREESRESVAAFWESNGLVIPYSSQEDRRIYSLFATSIIPRIYFCTDRIVTRVNIEKFGN